MKTITKTPKYGVDYKISECYEGLRVFFPWQKGDFNSEGRGKSYYILSDDLACESTFMPDNGGTVAIYRGVDKILLLKSGIVPIPDERMWVDPYYKEWDYAPYKRMMPSFQPKIRICDYYIRANSYTEACKALAKQGLLNGHMLIDKKGHEIPVGFMMGELYPYYTQPLYKQCVLTASEDYWQPSCISIYRELNGTYTYVCRNRSLHTTVTSGLSLMEAFGSAKRFCRFHDVKFHWDSNASWQYK